MNHDLTLIILNFNTPQLVMECLQSIKKFHLDTSTFSTEVVVVDNGSSDNSADLIASNFPWVKVIATGKNLGFSGGNNVALRLSKSRYNMLLNSDTELTKDSNIDQLLTFLDSHEHIAVCSPKLVLDSGEIDFASHRGEPTPWASFTYFSKLAKLFPKSKLFAQYHQTYLDLSTEHQIDACSGAAMIVRASAMEKVGLLDEDFFMYAEDLDWCKRFREAGYQIVYQPKSVIIHHKYQSGLSNKNGSVVKKTNSSFYDTMLQYFDKHYRKKYPFFVRWLIEVFIKYKKGVL